MLRRYWSSLDTGVVLTADCHQVFVICPGVCELCWSCAGVVLELCWSCAGVVLELSWSCPGVVLWLPIVNRCPWVVPWLSIVIRSCPGVSRNCRRIFLWLSVAIKHSGQWPPPLLPQMSRMMMHWRETSLRLYISVPQSLSFGNAQSWCLWQNLYWVSLKKRSKTRQKVQ